MRQDQLDDLGRWFETYVAGFYGRDPYVERHLRFKHCHSHRTAGLMGQLADDMDLNHGDRNLAVAIGLLHDVGRFEQFDRYRTYKDHTSIDHGRLGVEVLHAGTTLDRLEPAERDILVPAILLHGRKDPPADLPDRTAWFARLIRDADKLDIYQIVVSNYHRYRADPQGFELDLEFPDDPWCTPEILRAALAGERIDYHAVRTLNDMKLIQLGWVRDINFAAALRRVREAGFLERIAGFLPDGPEVRQILDTALRTLALRIEQGDHH